MQIFSKQLLGQRLGIDVAKYISSIDIEIVEG